MVGIVWYLCNQCLSPLKFEPCSWRGVLNTTFCDKVCQWFTAGQWFSPGTPVSFTNKTDCHERYNWNIVESGNKHHKPNKAKTCLLRFHCVFHHWSEFGLHPKQGVLYVIWCDESISVTVDKSVVFSLVFCFLPQMKLKSWKWNEIPLTPSFLLVEVTH